MKICPLQLLLACDASFASSALSVLRAKTTLCLIVFATLVPRAGFAAGITTQPQSQSVVAGSNAVFTVVASGQAPIFYQWLFNGVNLTNSTHIAGTTNSTLTISNVLGSDAGNYRVVVTNSHSGVTSSNAVLTVLFPPSITGQPASQSVLSSNNATFTATVAGTAPLSCQWRFNGVPLMDGGRVSGSTTTNLSIVNVQTNDAGAYQLGVTNNYGSVTSAVATLTVLVAPGIATQPTNQTVILGNTATFSVTAFGTAPLTCQWLLNGAALPANLITTVAGNGAAGYSGDGSAAGKAMLNSPDGVALDTNHNVFIADTSNHRIRKIDTNGVITTVAGIGTNGFSGDGGLATNASLNSPGGIGFDSAGNLFIADTANHRIRKVDVNGLITTVAGIGTNGYSGDSGPATNASLNSPAGIGFDSAGNLFVADTQNSRVRKVDINNVITTVAGNGSSAWPTAGDGGAATNAIVRYPTSVAADASGNLFIVDAGDDRVRKVDTNGIITTVAGNGNPTYAGDGGSATNASLYYPWGICLDASGNLFIADEANNRIRKVDTNSIITTVAGSGSWVYTGDNMAATNATLNFPMGVAVDSFGDLFIADTGNHRTREVEVTGYPTLTLYGVTANLAGNFQAIISNAYGSITSSIATLTVLLPPAIATQPVNQYELLGGSAAFAVTATGDAPLNYRWLLNGVPLSDNGRVSGTMTNSLTMQNVQTADAGAYQVVVTNAWGAVTSSIANLVIATARYVNASNPSPSAPYTSWATAATVIQNAIDAANVGDWIFVTNGVYTTGGRVVLDMKWNRVVMTNQVTVVSVNGPLMTTILGDVPPNTHTYGTRCVWLGSGATLSGFTIASGGNYYGTYNEGAYDDDGGGIRGESSSAVVTDCIITGNSGCWYGGGVDNATLINCLLTGNNAWQSGQAGLGGGAYNCTLVNCTVVGNSGELGSGGTAYSTCENCIVYDNPSSGPSQGNYFYTSFTDSCTTPDPSGVGNTTNDPAFVEYAGGDYRLQFNSPCIDTGSNAFVSLSTDLDGHPRIVGGVVDMGAYEYQHAPWFLTAPASQNILAGSNFSLTVTALGDPPAYQWWFNGAPLADGGRIVGSGSNMLTVSLSQTNDSGSYWLTASNSFGTATSAVATVAVLLPVAITSQPTNLTALTGSTATFTVGAMGFAPPVYLWYSNGVALVNGSRISGATSATLAIANVQTNDSGAAYQVIVTNNYGSITSAVATLTVIAPVQIITQPASQAVLLGSNVTFAVTATGSGPLNYQWYFNGIALADGSRISGSAAPTLNISNAQFGDAGGYVAVVTNILSSATSRTASLTPQASLAPSVRYVALTSTNPLSPYLDWSTAATNIQDAVDAAVAGDLVVVSNGVYSVGGRAVYGAATNRVVIDKAIAVHSVNGPLPTIIKGGGSSLQLQGGPTIRCVYLTNGAALIGLTLTNGGTISSTNLYLEASGGGVWCESSSAVVSNCVLAGNVAVRFGGGAFGGTLIGCLLTNNTASQGGGACSNVLLNCTLTRNSASFQNLNTGGGAIYSTLSNCLLVANNCIGGGGGASVSTLSSCVLSNNTAGYGGGVCQGVVNNSLIASNRAGVYGGGAYSSGLFNCVLKNNLAARSGGAAYSSGLTNCTVVGNASGTFSVDSGTVANSIVYDNPGGNIINSKAVFYTCSIPAFGTGCFTNAPLFVNEANGDYHLQTNSPCINSGNNAYVTVTNDLDGNPRIAGGTVDIGAYEYQTPTSLISYAWLQQYGFATDGSADDADYDGTGMNNWQKWIAGLNPTNPASVLVMLTPASTNNPPGLAVSWQSVSGITYFLQSGTNLAMQPAFSTIQSNIVGQAGTTTYMDATATNIGLYFYRVGVQ